MKFEDYTKPQQLAITTTGNVIVSAGAGSGKTQVLTERVKYFIKNKGLHLDEFLILTFTNLAASEMKDRIRKALTEEEIDDANLVDTADISTFDSYALSIVKKYHFLLNVSPNISIIDSNIISVRKRTIIEDIFEELYKENDPEFLKLIDNYTFKDDDEIKNLTLKLYEKALLSENTLEYLDTYTDKFYSDEKINEMILETSNIIKEEREDLIKEFDKCSTRPTSKKDPRPFNVVVLEVIKKFLEADTYDELLNALPESLGLRSPSGLDEIEKENNTQFLNKLKNLHKELLTYPKTSILFKEFVLSNKEYANVLIRVIKELDKRINKYKEKYQVFEFNDIAKLALNLVKENEEIKNTIKNKLKMIMIDEYQDTSFLQEAFISEIANNNVYMVGDVKQSIYRFRNARCDIFMDKYDKYKNNDGGVAIDLNKNFRSRKEVLSDINYIFKNLMTKEYGGASYKDSHIIEFGNTKYIKEGFTNSNNHSSFIFHEKSGENDPVVEAELIATDIIDKINNHYQVMGKDGLRDCKFSDFCILMDRGTDFETYSQIFSTYHLPLYVENDENISECEIVLILINVLKLIKSINTNDYTSVEFKKAFLGVTRSFLFNYSDDELYKISKENLFKQDPIIMKLKDILFNYSTYPLYRQLEEIIFNFDIYNKLIYSGNVTKNEKYLDMFLNMFSEMNKLDYSLEDFIIYMENIENYDLKITLSSTGSSVDSIKIMNIHKSKGLEFSIIYFSGLYKGFNQSEYKSNFGVSNKYGLILKPLDSNMTNILKVLNKRYEIKEDISERIRLFYVALTRTKEKMIFIMRDNSEYTILKNNDDEKAMQNFITQNDLDNKKIMDIIKIIVKALNQNLINKGVFLKILNNYNIPRPSKYEYFNSPSFIIKEEDLLNECMEIENTLSKYESRSIDNRETIISLYSALKSYDIDDVFFKYALNKYGFMLTQVDSSMDEITRDNIININEHLDKDNIQEPKNLALLNYMFSKIVNREYKLNINLISKLHSYCGYDLTDLTKDFFVKAESEILEDSVVREFIDLDFETKYIPNSNLNLDYSNFLSRLFSLILIDYQKGNITLYDFNYLLGLYNYELDLDFINQDKEVQKNLDPKFIMDIVSIKHVLVVDINKATSFNDFLWEFYFNEMFTKDYYKEENLNKELIIKKPLEEQVSLDIKNLNISNEKIEIFRASKTLDLDSKNSNMDFGTKLHFIMEVTDFLNPDLSNYDMKTKEIVTNFLNSSLLQNVKDASIYKEYEFLDEANNTNGIIDLMLIYKDHIDIIDYKTKNIDDEGYDKQLKVYKDYAKAKFNLPVNTYLYSLLTGNIRECV